MDLLQEIQEFKLEVINKYSSSYINFLYLRLSKINNTLESKEKQIEETMNKLRADFEKILETYPNLKEEGFQLFIEVKSAYKDSIREEFVKLYDNYLFNDIKSVRDILEKENITQEKRLYIASFDRLSRVFLYSLSFHLIRLQRGINIYSCLEDEIYLEKKAKDILERGHTDQLIYIFQLMINSSQHQKHSEDMSNKIKRRVVKDKGKTISSKTGKKWGAKETISNNMRKRILERYNNFTAKEISEQADIFQVRSGQRKPISINTIRKIIQEGSRIKSS